MEMMSIQVKRNGRYHTTHEYSEVLHRDEIHERLMNDLLSRYVLGSPSVTRITERSNGDGTRTVTAYYSNDTRTVYVIYC